MKRFVLLFAIMLSLVTLSACVSPKVKYINLKGRDYEGYTKFRLVGSDILITSATALPTDPKSFADVSKAETVQPSDIAVSVVPREQGTAVYAIVPKSQWLGMVNTKIQATYYDNSRIIHQLGTKVEDSRIKIIQAIGAAAVQAVMFDAKTADKADEKLTLPVIINPDDFDFGTWAELPGNPAWSFRLTQKPQPEDIDAMPVTDFFDKYDDAHWFNSTSVFPVSSCRSVKLNIINLSIDAINGAKKKNSDIKGKNSDPYNDPIEKSILEEYRNTKEKLKKKEKQQDKTEEVRMEREGNHLYAVQLANPNYVRTVRMPDAGTVLTHTVCGADTTTEASNTATGYELISELMKQARAVYDAQKKN